MYITAIILTKNEEKNIASCIESVRWCDEILVIDDNSTDQTTSYAKEAGAIVYTHSLDDNFAQQRNFGVEKAQGDWILFLDADERVSTSLIFEIQGKITQPLDNYMGYFIKRQDVMWGKILMHGETANIRLLRLAKKDAGIWKGKVHETWEITGKTEILDNPLIHLPHQTLTNFLKEINFYTTIRAQELFEKKVKVFWWHIIAYPKAKFFVNFFLKQGYKDGIPGLIVAILMSLHSFLVRGKLWLLWHKK